MNWKEEVIGRVHRKDLMIAKFEERAEKANLEGDSAREKNMYARADMAEQYVEGAIYVLESIGYTIEFANGGDVKDILGEYSTVYRVRYKHFELENYVFCDTREKIQEIIDRAKKLDIEIPGEYKLVGIDDRIVYPNGEVGEWNKIFDF